MEFGLIGYPLGHSFSKKYYDGKFSREHIHATFENFELLSVNDFPGLIKSHPNLNGIAVTSPYKKIIIPFLSAMDEVVEKTGSCNCIKVQDKKLVGFNTDVAGFRNSLKPLLKDGFKALVLGTGGAAQSVAYVLKKLAIPYFFVSRKQKNRETVLYSDLEANFFTSHKLIINCTPIGTFPNINQAPAIPYNYINSDYLLYDLIYNPEKSRFLQLGEKQGAAIKNGLEMLEIQAEENYKIWVQ